MAPWFKRSDKAIKGDAKKNIPDGVWVKCKSCGDSLFNKDLVRHLQVCPNCNFHFRFTSEDYFNLLLDDSNWEEHDNDLVSTDFLEFKDTLKYSERIVNYTKKSGLKDAIRCVSGTMNGRQVQIAAMDFTFMGGSVGSVVGEKINRAILRAANQNNPLVVISCSGGMRMQEGVMSLMQMAKASSALVRLSRANQPFISLLTNPTTGGTTASFAMLGDINISEPAALIGFAGPRVIKQTIGQDLPKGFQSAEFLLEHGFLDMIVERKKLRKQLISLFDTLKPVVVA